MESRRFAQAVFLVGIFVLIPLFVVRPIAHGWADWVVYGVMVALTFGAFRTIYERRYTTEKRTFIRRDPD